MTTFKPPISCDVEPMDESLEFIFFTMMRQGEISEAIDFIRSIDVKYIPSKGVLGSIIFEILMKCEDIKSLSKAAVYLSNILKIFPPINEERRVFYYDFIRSTHGILLEIWAVLDRIVNSYFYHNEIYINKNSEKEHDLKYPNCKFLLEFYIKLFTIDFEYCSDSCKACLIENLLWPTGDISSTKRVECVLKWINDIYNSPFVNQQGDLLRSLHDLMSLMIKYVLSKKNNLSEVTAFNDPCLAKMVEDIINFCPNARQSNNLKLFLTLLPLKSVKARVSEKIIKMHIKQSLKPLPILTLKNIVSLYMYPQKSSKSKFTKVGMVKGKLLRRRSADKKLETTKLHELCRKNKFADLIVALKSSYEHLNTRDQNGSTPLLEACQAGNYMCVEMLINESGKGLVPKLDYTIANFDGCTPLHIAVQTNSTDIAQILLENGGSGLLNITDCSGQCPHKFCKSEEMENLLQSFYSDLSELEPFIDQTQEVPVLKTFKDYSIYLHALNCLLCNYCNIFELYNLKPAPAKGHRKKMCYHYRDSDTCSEDISVLRELPNIVEAFIQSVLKNASKVNLPIDIEIIPLKAFAASLKSIQL